jgi:signal transduction histidine kinase
MPDGSERFLQANACLIRDRNGAIAGVVISCHDMTREREIDRMKTEIISTASHELRSPLTTILGYAELLHEFMPIQPDEQARMIGLIYRKARNLSRIVSDLLDISRIESGIGLELHREETDIRELVRNAVAEYEHLSPSHTFAVSMPERGRMLHVDRQKMEEVIGNILSNAIKYSPDGGRVTVQGGQAGDVYEIRIADQGIGMTPAERDRVFEKFYRANHVIEGTGLGMSIVDHFVRAHGGTVAIESERGAGTTVTIAIPSPERFAGLADG